MAERFKALVSKTSGVFMALVGSNPTPSAIRLIDAPPDTTFKRCRLTIQTVIRK